MSEIDELRNRVAVLEAALTGKSDAKYDVILVPKPEPLKFTGYWTIWMSPRKCHAHVHRSWRAADNAARYGNGRKDMIRIDWEEGQTEGRWVSVLHGDIE